ncbi:FMN-binding negative transcriptional regulator [Pikeienuella piscinae]|uniref:FMN-binding negative transcriptional regulator n=1 Tax=Pikeienuella piscinae TaxID=2748098 RepID=A0A7L5C113_9RHOB|nr:FMN-binding negative transcriptional regulator [Pikeienuella piscinae]QIE56477.1 FMN-binding negative transcriptional regulator [Pikeienuella piscinae]
MHPNQIYRAADAARNLIFARERGFGVVTIGGDDEPLASHIPFLIDAAGERLEAHIVRSNPIWRRLRAGPARALVAISGPDGYVSPDWYGEPDLMPTWNYVAVHLKGELRLADQAGLRAHLAALSATFETRLAPKAPWTLEKMEPEALQRMMRMIAPVEMRVDAVEGTWKFSQNKSDAARAGAADGVENAGLGAETAALASLMRAPPV